MHHMVFCLLYFSFSIIIDRITLLSLQLRKLVAGVLLSIQTPLPHQQKSLVLNQVSLYFNLSSTSGIFGSQCQSHPTGIGRSTTQKKVKGEFLPQNLSAISLQPP